MNSRRIIIGNWKMNGSRSGLAELSLIADHPRLDESVRIGMALPATLIPLAEAAGKIEIGAQDLHAADAGAHTGSISGAMLHEAGARFTIVGHSERRGEHGESDMAIASKIGAAWRHRLCVVLCVGETAAQRASGDGETAVREQLRAVPTPLAGELIVAYEPVWCIGAATAASTGDIATMLDLIRDDLTERLGDEGTSVPLLYGGAVDADNAEAILAMQQVDGVLVGRASLSASTFVSLIDACLTAGS